MTYGKLLRQQRKDRGLTQLDVTLATRIPQNQISDYEAERTVPSVTRFVKMLRALGVETLDLTVFELEMEDSEEDKGLYLDYV